VSRLVPLLASEATAAKLMDMPVAEFRRLVQGGHLPGPVRIGDAERWPTEDLVRIAKGEAAEGLGDVRW
jgi:hypothetical protein